jgi:hypothetical protein
MRSQQQSCNSLPCGNEKLLWSVLWANAQSWPYIYDICSSFRVAFIIESNLATMTAESGQSWLGVLNRLVEPFISIWEPSNVSRICITDHCLHAMGEGPP